MKKLLLASAATALFAGAASAQDVKIGILLGFSPVVAFVAGMGFVLTSTAIVMQILSERGELNSPQGQKIVSILLLEDLGEYRVGDQVAGCSAPEIRRSTDRGS